MNKLKKIRDDHVSGATEITIGCLEYLGEQAEKISTDDPNKFVLELYHIGADVKAVQPAMAPVSNAIHFVLIQVEKALKDGFTVRQLKEVTNNAARNFINNVKCALKSLAEEGVALIENGQIILTYSSSRAVAAILKLAAVEEKSFEVIVPESRPMCEGRMLAQDLGSASISCTVIVDGAASVFMKEAHLVLVGSDRVSEESVINKVGTRGLALMAKESNIPIYCACETTKFLRSDLLPFSQNEMPPGEIWAKPPENIRIRNLYFEEIPLDFFTGIITERGILDVDDTKKLIQAIST